jgi:hypothetical protein
MQSVAAPPERGRHDQLDGGRLHSRLHHHRRLGYFTGLDYVCMYM